MLTSTNFSASLSSLLLPPNSYDNNLLKFHLKLFGFCPLIRATQFTHTRKHTQIPAPEVKVHGAVIIQQLWESVVETCSRWVLRLTPDLGSDPLRPLLSRSTAERRNAHHPWRYSPGGGTAWKRVNGRRFRICRTCAHSRILTSSRNDWSV